MDKDLVIDNMIKFLMRHGRTEDEAVEEINKICGEVIKSDTNKN